MSISEVRPSPIAGQWYPADPARLALQVDEYINLEGSPAQAPEIEGEILGLVVPHAGHRYSGPVAGYAFAAVRGMTPELVAVAAPMHYPYSEPLLTTAHAAYATPLGEIPVDTRAVQAVNQGLKKRLGFGLSAVAYDPEHALEIELPFLQRSLAGPFSLLPLMVREQSARVVQSLGECLAGTVQARKSLLIASSDLSHFYPQATAERLDAAFLSQVLAFDPEGVLRIEEEGKGFACGRAAVAVVLWAARELGANHVQLLRYATSGDVSGEYERVVGYAALAITRKL